ncbi:methylenetetrahydrofolate reductase [NAD(P)H] [Dehalobacter sp. DCM]|uniref:methylenetetrahydrofolate reductase [NAD(P)H] n=1 Tax=Dehalobacter sp. DCM TaxID=2907827 RepID=UPI003081880B|nr:methylenetetrahydrofolate reductase [NAD(P)H] [Dehalobacter sp. DCM]
MNILEKFETKKAVVSFEVFPPKQIASIDMIHETIDGLAPLRPDYISVTYGAGGSSSNNTIEIASKIRNKYRINALAHLTCVGSSKAQIDTILMDLKNKGINHIMVLRGDLPQNADPVNVFQDFKHASDLAAYITDKSDFCLGGACYPETHPECPDINQDVDNLKRKIEAGVQFLITQLFLDNEKFYRFRDKLEQNRIAVPIQAGIMPVTNVQLIERMVKLSNTRIPKKLARTLEKFEHNQEAIKDAGIAYASEQIIELLANDVNGIHLYTMNKPQTAKDIMKNVGTMVYALNEADNQISA